MQLALARKNIKNPKIMVENDQRQQNWVFADEESLKYANGLQILILKIGNV